MRRIANDALSELGPDEHEQRRDEPGVPQSGTTQSLHQLHERDPQDPLYLFASDRLVQPDLEVRAPATRSSKAHQVEIEVWTRLPALELRQVLSRDVLSRAERVRQRQPVDPLHERDFPVAEHEKRDPNVVRHLRASDPTALHERPLDPPERVHAVGRDAVLGSEAGPELLESGPAASQLDDRDLLILPGRALHVGDHFVELDPVRRPSERPRLELPGFTIDVDRGARPQGVGLDDFPHPRRDLRVLREGRIHSAADDRRLQHPLLHDALEVHALGDRQLQHTVPPSLGTELERHAPTRKGAVRRIEVRLAKKLVGGPSRQHPERSPLARELGEASDIDDGRVEPANHRGPYAVRRAWSPFFSSDT